jgi:clan AA aspartic protease (TIGR02281 family)
MGLSMRVILWVCVILLLQVPWSWGKIYKWIDNNDQVHFTDNPAKIPEVYRNQIEAHTPKEAPSDALVPRQARDKPHGFATPSRATRQPQVFVIPLKREGNALFVQVAFNDFVHVPLMVDTGAALTVISTKTAQRLGLDLDRAALIPMRSTSGTFLAHLTKVRSMRVGNAIVKDVEVIVHDIALGRERGLLGMSFLDHFNVTIHTLQATMVLKPRD